MFSAAQVGTCAQLTSLTSSVLCSLLSGSEEAGFRRSREGLVVAV